MWITDVGLILAVIVVNRTTRVTRLILIHILNPLFSLLDQALGQVVSELTLLSLSWASLFLPRPFI
jgi:hypothetical protein